MQCAVGCGGALFKLFNCYLVCRLRGKWVDFSNGNSNVVQLWKEKKIGHRSGWWCFKGVNGKQILNIERFLSCKCQGLIEFRTTPNVKHQHELHVLQPQNNWGGNLAFRLRHAEYVDERCNIMLLGNKKTPGCFFAWRPQNETMICLFSLLL